MKIINCKICNTEFVPRAHNQLCCSDKCRAINKKRCDHEFYERRRLAKANGEPIAKRKKKSNKVNLKKFPKHSLFYDKDINKERHNRIIEDEKETARINREAREQGLSYGQYVSKLEFQKHQEASIEYMLKAQRKASVK